MFSHQFGLKKLPFTFMDLVILQDKLTICLDNGEYVIEFFLGFSKAFDTVDHAIFLKKLSA